MGLRRALVAIVVTVALLAALGYPIYVDPGRDRPDPRDPADAIVVLGGVPYTATYGARLLQDGVGGRLVISNAYPPGYPTMRQLCPEPPPAGVTCFVPEPFTTRGEAQEIGRLARANGWDDVIVVAPTFHITRARFITKRCYSGRLRMIDPYISFPWYQWTYQYVYQTTGFIKASFQRGC